MTNEEAMTVLRGLLDRAKKQHTTKRAKMQRMLDAGKTPSASMRVDVERAEYTVQQATAAIARLHALLEAPAFESVRCETCNGASVIVTYVDPYERGDVSSPEQSPCHACTAPPIAPVGVDDAMLQDIADATAALDKRGDRQMASRLMRLHTRLLATQHQEPKS